MGIKEKSLELKNRLENVRVLFIEALRAKGMTVNENSTIKELVSDLESLSVSVDFPVRVMPNAPTASVQGDEGDVIIVSDTPIEPFKHFAAVDAIPVEALRPGSLIFINQGSGESYSGRAIYNDHFVVETNYKTVVAISEKGSQIKKPIYVMQKGVWVFMPLYELPNVFSDTIHFLSGGVEPLLALLPETVLSATESSGQSNVLSKAIEEMAHLLVSVENLLSFIPESIFTAEETVTGTKGGSGTEPLF